jgi:menaquinone-dependent protoporphyrinogen oxidase
MAKTLIVYETSEGQTANIARFIAEIIRENGHQVEVLDVKHIPFTFGLDKFDSFIFGGSVHVNHLPGELKSFIYLHQSLIRPRPSALFSVSLTEAAHGVEARTKIENYFSEFLDELDWQPSLTASFAGAITYTRYGYFKRSLLKQVSRANGLGTDPNRDYEYTNWRAVHSFADEFGGLLA